MTNTPGVDSFSLAISVEKKLNFITNHKESIELLLKQNDILLDNFTFKIESKREDKYFPIESYTVCKELGDFILNNFSGSKVKMKNPDFTLTVEIRHKIFLVGNKIPGLGGLPVSTTGEGLLLLSGGIDSPVAGIKMTIRGMSLKALF
ncbi:MAG: tRNA 4-thiouridine(8) synthase ThiI, partial [Gammaproteobacteria bacterium]|nr:tRNA 4-thiouridine(8) synthase ThiI [Gammaproteobacteria bacterium]